MAKADKRILTLEEQQRRDDAASPWEWPEMPSAEAAEPARTNALGMAADWRRTDPHPAESDEPSEAEPLPALTASELEAIRQAAYEEGKQEGHQQGYEEGRELGRQQGYEAGHQQGMQAGHDQGLAQGQADIEALVASWQQLLDALHAPRRQIDAEVERQILQLVLALVREVVKVELETNPSVILRLLRESIDALPVIDTPVRIRLHPEDLALVEQAFSPDECRKRGWELLSEPGGQRGDIQLNCGDSAVEVLLEERVAELMRNFLLENQPPAGQVADE